MNDEADATGLMGNYLKEYNQVVSVAILGKVTLASLKR
jgi:hypothetical protein